MGKTSLSNMWAQTQRGGGGGGGGMLLVRSGGVVLVRSQAQLLWPIYPRHSSTRGCGGGLDELARQSMKQRDGVCMTGGGGVEEEMDEDDEKQMEGMFFYFFLLSACDAG